VTRAVQLERPNTLYAVTGPGHDLAHRLRRDLAVSWILSAAGILVSTTVFILFVPALWHWMILPTSTAGVLIGVDVVEWLRRRIDVLQPRSVVAIFGLHLVYLGPLLHVALDYWPRYVAPAQDWRASLGILAVVNTVGLVLYRLVISLRERSAPLGSRRLDVRRFISLGILAVLIGLSALTWVVMKFGGPAGYLQVITGNRQALTGNGWLLIIAESWPMLLFAMVLVSRRSWFRTHLLPLLILLTVFLLVQFLTSGLRGSRGNTVWPAVMAVGLIHLLVRRVRRRVLVAGALILIAFMYVYGFYKSVGVGVLGLAEQKTSTTALARETGRTMQLLLLEDFGRAGTQSVVTDRLTHGGGLAWGMTYVGDLVKLTPDALVPNPPVDKNYAGTDLLYGTGAYDAGLRSSRIFGLVGEGMLNFGLAGGALAFLPFAIFVRWADRVWRTALTSDGLAVKLVAPSLVALCLLALGSDFDNVVWSLYAQVLPLAAVVWVAGGGRPKLRPMPMR
jgi:hypothetical protein